MYIGRYLGVVDYAFLLILIISSCSATPLEGLWAFLLSLGWPRQSGHPEGWSRTNFLHNPFSETHVKVLSGLSR